MYINTKTKDITNKKESKMNTKYLRPFTKSRLPICNTSLNRDCKIYSTDSNCTLIQDTTIKDELLVDNAMFIKTCNIEYSKSDLVIEDFPIIPELDNMQAIPVEYIQSILDNDIFSYTIDQSMREGLDCINISNNKIVATDGTKLISQTISWSGGILIRRSIIKLLKGKVPTSASYNTTHVEISGKDFQLITTIPDIAYPNTDFLTTNNSYSYKTQVDNLSAIIKILKPYGIKNKYGTITVTFNENKVSVGEYYITINSKFDSVLNVDLSDLELIIKSNTNTNITFSYNTTTKFVTFVDNNILRVIVSKYITVVKPVKELKIKEIKKIKKANYKKLYEESLVKITELETKLKG